MLVGVVAISVSVALQGQNVAQLVGLGYAVAASANLPALMLTLYWRRCTTQGVLAGIIGGTLAAVALVMVSPNMEYPALERASAIHRVQDLTGKLSNAADDKSRTVLRRELIDAETVVQMMPAKETSIVGLRAPLIGLRNPGIVSIPIGFLLVVLISLFTRDRVSESRWAELVVRRETAIGAAVATNH